ncbi:MAG: cupin domain-containing protein [Thermoplasmata archaeon]
MNRIGVVSRHAVGSPERTEFGRTPAFETDTVRVGETHVAAGSTSPWHHHGRRTVSAFVVSGELILEFGPHGREKVQVSDGDFFRIPAGLVHRDVNPTPKETKIVNLMVGDGPATTDLEGADP